MVARSLVGVSMATISSAVLMLGGGTSAASAATDNCANAEFRVGPSALLPDCRAYELVSPADKGGYTLVLNLNAAGAYASRDGDHARFSVITPFADPKAGYGGQYVSTRGAAGWTTKNMSPAFCGPDPSGLVGAAPVLALLSVDFSFGLFQDSNINNCAPGDTGGPDVYSVGPDGRFVWQSQNGPRENSTSIRTVAGLSADGRHLAFETDDRLILPLEAGRTGPGLYERVGDRLFAVGLGNDGQPINPCGASIAGGTTMSSAPPGSVADDGRVIFFVSGSGNAPGCSPTTNDGGQLYARIDGERTVLLSRSDRSTPDARQLPVFLGATTDGGTAFFRSTERLTDDATTGGGLYAFDLGQLLDGSGGSGHLRFLTPAVDSSPAGVTSLLGFSEDGAVGYVAATGRLHADAPASGSKIYRVSQTGATLVAATTASAATVSPDGSKLAYVARPGTFDQVMLFAAGAGSGPVCVSCPTAGSSVGHARMRVNNRPRPMGDERFVSNDGRVFFNSLDRLVVADTNATHDVYEYDRGEHKLLSSGTSQYHSLLWGVGPAGREVFFSTADSLVPGDVDNGDLDLYVARIGGGFAAPPLASDPCSGDACQHPGPGTPGGLVPGTWAFSGTGDLPESPADEPSVTRLSLLNDRRSVGGRSGSVRVRTSGPGRVRTSGAGLRQTIRSVSRAGTAYRVAVRLSPRATRTLERRGRVQTRVTVRFTPVSGPARSVRVRMTFRTTRSSRASTRASSDERSTLAVAASPETSER